jgi:hypothetical protein
LAGDEPFLVAVKRMRSLDTAFTVMMLETIEMDAKWLAEGWLIPCGPSSSVPGWWRQAERHRDMVPVLTRAVHTPVRSRQ